MGEGCEEAARDPSGFVLSELSAWNVPDPIEESVVDEINDLRAQYPELAALPMPVEYVDLKVVSGTNATVFIKGWFWVNHMTRDLWHTTVEMVTE